MHQPLLVWAPNLKTLNFGDYRATNDTIGYGYGCTLNIRPDAHTYQFAWIGAVTPQKDHLCMCEANPPTAIDILAEY